MAFLGRLEEARAGARAGLALNPHFTIARYRATFGDTGIQRLFTNSLCGASLRMDGGEVKAL